MAILPKSQMGVDDISDSDVSEKGLIQKLRRKNAVNAIRRFLGFLKKVIFRINPRCKMSVLSFKTYCIENYAEYTGKASSEVYELFVRSGLLKMLQDDYEDLHGMGKEYLMDFLTSGLEEKRVTIRIILLSLS